MWFQCVSLLPQDIHGPEDREMLARLAASTEDDQSADSEAAIEKYLRSVLAVENILTLDRLRQVRKDVLRRLRQHIKTPFIPQPQASFNSLKMLLFNCVLSIEIHLELELIQFSFFTLYAI